MAVNYIRSYYEKEIEEFENSDVFDEYGVVDYNKYRAWFFNFLSTKCPKGSDVNNYLDAINLANFIAQTAFQDKEIKMELFAKNGGAEEKEVIKYVFESAEPESKKLLIDRMIKLELSKGMKNDKNTFGEDTSSASGDDTAKNELDDKDAIETAILLFMPTFVNHLNENDIEAAEADRAYFEKLVLEAGYQKKSIQDSVEKLLDLKEEKIQKKQMEEKKYNPYQDFRFLAYMYSLGMNYNMNLFAKALTNEASFKSVVKDIKDVISVLVSALNVKPDQESEIYKKSYIMNYIQFKSKYGAEFNLESVVEALHEDSSEEMYKQIYITTLQRAYGSVDSIENIVQFVESFESLMNIICQQEGFASLPAFGGASGEEIEDLLVALRNPDINLSVQTRNSLKETYGNLASSDAAVISKHVEDEFNGLLSSNDKAGICSAVAEYKVLNEIHASRTGSYSLLHPIKYGDEKSALKRMGEKLMSIEDSELRNLAKELLACSNIYKHGHEQEMSEIAELKSLIHKKQRSTTEIDLSEGVDEMAMLDFINTKTVKEISAVADEAIQPTVDKENN